MSFIRSFLFSFSMFSRLPMPTLKWHDDNMRYMLAMFPFIGAVVGLFVWAWLAVCQTFDFGVLLRSVGLALVPVAVTGGIHLDGLCDTMDALSSHAPPARKREILKDPRAGAFAVIGAVSYLVLYVGIASELLITPITPLLLGLIYVLCRCLSGLSVLLLNTNADKGLLSSFKDSADKTVSVIILGFIFTGTTVWLLLTAPLTGGMMLLAAFLCLIYLTVMSRRQFGGMSGDLAGFFLQLCELAMLASIVIVEKVV
ncbi:adenosylcobinamide-GDP ribazoletransferase [Oscillospiraceae bacterium WX1]